MRKRVSKRRWKARALLGQSIPETVIEEHNLGIWGEKLGDWYPSRFGLYWLWRPVMPSWAKS